VTYQQTLKWMFAQLPMYQKKGKAALNHKLDKTLLFDKTLGEPHKKFKSIHVAGTNGKGSSSHMLASVLQEAGYKVGLYTSPHLKDFRERIKINGQTTSEEFVVEFIAEHKQFLEENRLSFFEMTVGMAFTYFAEQSVDIAIIEVGLGGKLDSTNIITPEICLITNIGYDHVQILGDTLKQIATEKGGIIKPGVPVVISERQQETKEVFESITAEFQSPIFFAEEMVNEFFRTDLLGEYQAKNILGVTATLKKLKGFSIELNHIKEGLNKVVNNTGLMGRWQILQNAPKVVCDTAHNKEGLTVVLEQLMQQNFEKLFIVLGFVSDKEVEELLALFPKKATYFFAAPKIPRAMPVGRLELLASKFGLKGMVHESVRQGLNEAISQAKNEDLIFVGGSTFVVAEVI